MNKSMSGGLQAFIPPIVNQVQLFTYQRHSSDDSKVLCI